MSRLSPLPSHIRRTDSRASVAESDTTYHSFNDMDYELTEPPSPPRTKDPRLPHPSSTEMNRQDSGYESLPPRNSQSSRRRTSTTSSHSRPKSRPSTRRTTKPSTYLQHQSRASGNSLYLTRSHPQPLLPPAGHSLQFYHFPSPDPSEAVPVDTPPTPPADDELVESPFQAPPTTTHYWTSDRTRRLEYAAIDAASRGVKGWVMKHLVPDCFVPKESRRLCFDDDTGSVRRYRLELEEGEESPSVEKTAFGASSSSSSISSSKKGWRWSGKRAAGPSATVTASYGVY